MEDIVKFFGVLILAGIAIYIAVIVGSVIIGLVSAIGATIGSTVGFLNYVKAFRNNVYLEKPYSS